MEDSTLPPQKPFQKNHWLIPGLGEARGLREASGLGEASGLTEGAGLGLALGLALGRGLGDGTVERTQSHEYGQEAIGWKSNNAPVCSMMNQNQRPDWPNG